MLATVLWPPVMNKQTQNNGQRNHFYSKTRKFTLKYNSRYTSSIVAPSTRVKSPKHGKIFKTSSVTNLSAFSNNILKSKVNDTFLMTYFHFKTEVISLTVILHLLGCVSEQGELSAVKKTKMKSFEGSFRNLNFLPSTSVLLNFFFHL